MANFMGIDIQSAINNSVIGSAKDKAKYQDVLKTEEYIKFIKEIKAKRLDEVDACNIPDPSAAIAPNGCHYSLNDVEYTMNDYGDFNTEAIFSILAQVSKYSELPENAKKIDLSDKALLEWAISKNIQVSKEYKLANGIAVPLTEEKKQSGGVAPSSQSIEQAKNQRVSQPTDAVNQMLQGSANKLAGGFNLGTGFRITPKGKDTVEITKLAEGKTPCEPIYPDLIEVGDTVPEWVFSQSYASIRTEIQNSANIPTLNDSTSNEKQKQLEAVNKEIESFKENQFAKWIKSKGLQYNTQEEKSNAMAEYNKACVEDKDHFIDGIYIENSDDKGIYDALIRRRNELNNVIGSNLDEKTKKQEEEKKEKATDKPAEKQEEKKEDANTEEETNNGEEDSD